MSVERISATQARLRFAPSVAAWKLCVVARCSGQRVVRGQSLFAALRMTLMEPSETAAVSAWPPVAS
ncbi:MAG: hypothetical protein LBD24_01280 [Spirochaetaceae bacterium]|nr:hypothetical protein [Spirochaetaceae bacterium]